MKDQGEFCLKDTYGRGAGTPLTCKSDEQRSGALCYPHCKEGYKGVGPVCWQKCPHDMKDTGVACQKDSYGRGAGTVPTPDIWPDLKLSPYVIYGGIALIVLILIVVGYVVIRRALI